MNRGPAVVDRVVSFDQFVGIDYSGAATPQSRSATLQVYRADRRGMPKRVASPASQRRHRNWNRMEIAAWLEAEILAADQRGQSMLIGIDHGFSFPDSYFQRHRLKTWDAFLDDFVQHWPTDQPRSRVDDFRPGNRRTGTPDQWRLTERWTGGVKSVFHFDVQGSVAKSTHAGLPWLRGIRKRCQVHAWPFDGWTPPAHGCVIAEVFPSLFRDRYPREDRTVDQQDAYAVCRWMVAMEGRGRLADFFGPPLDADQSDLARREGWILGVF